MPPVRRILWFLAAVMILAQQAEAALPQTLNYQGRLTFAGGGPIPDSTGNTVVFRLFDSPSGGIQVWSEAWNGTVVSTNGLFNVVLGSNTPLAAAFDIPYWLEIQVNGDATPMAPRQPLTMAPYAFRAVSVAAPLNLTSSSAAAALYAFNSAVGTSVVISGSAGGTGTLAVRNGSGSAQSYAILSVTNGTGATRVGVVGASDPNFSNPSGPTGIYGYSMFGTGLAGLVDGPSNSGTAVRGENTKATGYGVIAYNSAPSGAAAIALSATSASTQGIAGYFQAVTGVVVAASAVGLSVTSSGPASAAVFGEVSSSAAAIMGVNDAPAGYGMQAENGAADATSGGAALFVKGPLKMQGASYSDSSANGTPAGLVTITTSSGRIRFTAVGKTLPAAGVYGPIPCSTTVLSTQSVVLVSFATNVATVFSVSARVNTAGNAFSVNVPSTGGVTFSTNDQLNFVIINQ
jgi:hypothetical protein